MIEVPTFLAAGHETTRCVPFLLYIFLHRPIDGLNSTAVTWALYALTQNREAQTKLRNELLAVSTDVPTMDELASLTYLDYVVRETMRVHAPVPSTVRVAGKDDVLPLNQPYTDKDGVSTLR